VRILVETAEDEDGDAAFVRHSEVAVAGIELERIGGGAVVAADGLANGLQNGGGVFCAAGNG